MRLLIALLAPLLLTTASAQGPMGPPDPETPAPCPSRTGSSLTVLVPPGHGLDAGAELRATTADGACVGSTVARADGFALTVHGDDPVTPSTDGALPGQPVTFEPDGLLVAYPVAAADSLDELLDWLEAEAARLIAENDSLENRTAALEVAGQTAYQRGYDDGEAEGDSAGYARARIEVWDRLQGWLDSLGFTPGSTPSD